MIIRLCDNKACSWILVNAKIDLPTKALQKKRGSKAVFVFSIFLVECICSRHVFHFKWLKMGKVELILTGDI